MVVLSFIFHWEFLLSKLQLVKDFLEDFWSALTEYTFCHCKQYFAFKSDSETLVSESIINS